MVGGNIGAAGMCWWVLMGSARPAGTDTATSLVPILREGRAMSKRAITLRTIPGPTGLEGQRILSLELEYDVGGTAMLSGSSFRRGYYMKVRTYSKTTYGDGTTGMQMLIGSKDDPTSDVSICDLILPADRFSAAKLASLRPGWETNPNLACCVRSAIQRTKWQSADPADDGFLVTLMAHADKRVEVGAPKPRIPYTIQCTLDYLGKGLSGARVYVGAGEVTWKCPRQEGECRPRFPSREDPDGSIVYDVGLEFPVNGPRSQQWIITITYEPCDDYTVRISRRTSKTPGIERVTMERLDTVYCPELKAVVEKLYDRWMLKEE